MRIENGSGPETISGTSTSPTSSKRRDREVDGKQRASGTTKVSKATLDRAKAFLCWDVFPNLSVQLIELQSSVAYFFPPFDRTTILVYYERGAADFSVPLFHLFHESGHCLQFEEMRKRGRESDFWKVVNTATGPSKTAFERQSWEEGKNLLEEFIHKNNLNGSLLKAYDVYAEKSIQSYR